MAIHSLINAFQQVGESPCEKFSCPKRAQCAEERLACTAFRYFVNTGRASDPRYVFPARVTDKQQPVLMRDIDPSRSVYDSMEVDRDASCSPSQEEEELQILSGALASRPALQTVWG